MEQKLSKVLFESPPSIESFLEHIIERTSAINSVTKFDVYGTLAGFLLIHLFGAVGPNITDSNLLVLEV